MDDSIVQQELLLQVLQSDPDIKVVGTAFDGEEAIRKVQKLNPDIVTMDINMPKMDGIQATKKIMELHPVPIIIISSSLIQKETALAFEALDAGALVILDKIQFVEEQKKEIILTVKLMSEIKVVRRYRHNKNNIKKEKAIVQNTSNANIKLIAIGVSTGGPSVLQEMFLKLLHPFPPILVVQHIGEDFLEGLIEWLRQTTACQIKIAEDNELLEPNWIYFAPTGFQMGLRSIHQISLSKVKMNGHIPSVSFLFNSIAKMAPKNSLGVLLTGMGKDGADGLKLMRDKGAYTIAQDEESCIVYGMPREAVILGAAQQILNPEAIVNYINSCDYAKKN